MKTLIPLFTFTIVAFTSVSAQAEPQPASDPMALATACKGGEADACFTLGQVYNEGAGVIADPKKAHLLWQTACKGGHADACAALKSAEATPQGPSLEDVKKFTDACSQGHAEACHNVGLMNLWGHGVDKNPKQAFAMFQKACDGKVLESCTNLGVCYMDGVGVAQDRTKGRAILAKSCEAGEKVACGQLKPVQ